MVTTVESLKKAFLIGLGATVLTAERVRELIDELLERGEITQQEAKGFADDLKTRALKEREQFEAWIREQVETTLKKTVDSLGLVTKQDLENLRNELQNQQHN